jgi:hypothetical protein
VLDGSPLNFLWSAMPAFGFGVLAAYIDIDSFFRSKRTSFTTDLNFLCYFFLGLNGALAAGLVIWAIGSDADSVINSIVHVQSPAAKTAVISFAVPLILRSKLFSFGEDQTPEGPALAYDWARLKVLYDINMRSAIVKDQLSEQYASTLAAATPAVKTAFPAKVKTTVDNYVRPFATAAEKDQLEKEYAAISAAHVGANSLSEDHFRELVRWAIDSTKISYVKQRLRPSSRSKHRAGVIASEAKQSRAARDCFVAFGSSQ